MLEIGVQTKNIIYDDDPRNGFELLAKTGFTACDFSLNAYLINGDIYKQELNHFFDQSVEELEVFFTPHKEAAKKVGIRIHQMHMPYPMYVPTSAQENNHYLWDEVAPKSMEICRFLECQYIVIHGFKLLKYLGTEELEWQETERFIDSIAPLAKRYGITICIENLYDGLAGRIVEGPCCDARKAAQRIDKLNEKYGAEIVGFCFDIGHANLVRLNMEDFLVTLGSRLKVLHLHDNDGLRDLHQLPFTFTKTRENTSSTDWESFLRGLKRIGFHGVLSFETAPVLDSFPEELREDALLLVNKIGKYLKKSLE